MRKYRVHRSAVLIYIYYSATVGGRPFLHTHLRVASTLMFHRKCLLRKLFVLAENNYLITLRLIYS